jgi:cellulose synthase/poly-beta-1,6-N-acetylglucosamine synthase-like glycosyltransferase
MMLIIKIVSVLSLGFYLAYLIRGMIGFYKTNYFTTDPTFINKTHTAIIICARNEESTIEKCISGIASQNFDKELLEIIMVNDGSTDNTKTIAENSLKASGIKFQLINNPQSIGKKKSITSAIEICNADLIICRDADTYTQNENWLKTIVSFHETSGKQFIIAPLEIENKNGLIHQLQFYENSALAIITSGYAYYETAFLCSGANLAFTKKIFEKAGGYKSHIDLISGDDVLFLEDVKKTDPETVAYLKNTSASIVTYPVTSLSKLFSQKIRWASKFDKNPNQINAFLGLIVTLVHVFSLFYLIKPIFTHHIPLFGLIFVFLRVFIDFLLLFLASRYFNKSVKWGWFLPLSVVYSFYVLITTALSLVIKPKQN